MGSGSFNEAFSRLVTLTFLARHYDFPRLSRFITVASWPNNLPIAPSSRRLIQILFLLIISCLFRVKQSSTLQQRNNVLKEVEYKESLCLKLWKITLRFFVVYRDNSSVLEPLSYPSSWKIKCLVKTLDMNTLLGTADRWKIHFPTHSA